MRRRRRSSFSSALRLLIPEETVKVHIKHIMEKLGVRDCTEAVAIAVLSVRVNPWSV